MADNIWNTEKALRRWDIQNQEGWYGRYYREPSCPGKRTRTYLVWHV